MRPLELAILASVLLPILGTLVAASRRPRWLRYIPWVCLALVFLQLVVEGYRWQMIPAYVLTGIFILLGSVPPKTTGYRRAGRLAGTTGLIVLFAVAVALPGLMPVFTLPAPTGPFPVGTSSLQLIDSSRPEEFAHGSPARRELLIQVWYPAARTDSRPEPLVSLRIAREMARAIGLPAFFFDQLRFVETHSHPGASLSEQRTAYPVLIFSHGYLGTPEQNTVQMEELASHGYVIFSVGHTYEASALQFPDGRFVVMSKDVLRKMSDIAKERNYGALLYRLLASRDPAQRAKLLEENTQSDTFFTSRLQVWSADTSFVLDELQAQSPVAGLRKFIGRLDLTRIGVFGMSFGGADATDVCLRDSRCRAGINMDGIVFGAAATRSSALKVPFMFVSSERYSLLSDPVFRRTQAPSWYLTVNSATHLDFTDMSLVSPFLRMRGLMGAIPGKRVEQIMNAYILAFFDQTLLGRKSPLLDGASTTYPEVELRMRSGSGD